MTSEEVETEIRRCLTRLTDEDASNVPENEDLGEAIGLDSLGRLELLSEVEDRLDLTIYEADSMESMTIAGMRDIVVRALTKKEHTQGEFA